MERKALYVGGGCVSKRVVHQSGLHLIEVSGKQRFVCHRKLCVKFSGSFMLATCFVVTAGFVAFNRCWALALAL